MLYFGLAWKSIIRLQLIQNVLVKAVMKVSCYIQVKPLLWVLHCLPVGFYVQLKALMVFFEALHGSVFGFPVLKANSVQVQSL